jgi:hypothetical protein
MVAASLVLPLKFKERLNGFIVLGPRIEKDYYNQYDLKYCNSLRIRLLWLWRTQSVSNGCVNSRNAFRKRMKSSR